MRHFLAMVAVCLGTTALAQTTSLTYQGRLIDNGLAATGTYDLRWTLYDASSAGTSVATALTNVTVMDGLILLNIDFGTNVFDGSNRWLELAVRTNGSTGNFTSLAPRQSVTSVPYSIQALNATTVRNGVYASGNQTFAGANQFTNSGNSFFGSGAGLTNVNAGTLNGLSSTKFWQTGGNLGTASTTNYLGTGDNQAFELRVNGSRAFRIEPNASGPNIIGGSSLNTVGLGSAGSFIGGGDNNIIQANSEHSFIGGGTNNTIQNSAYYSVVAGGSANTIQTLAASSTIGGGTGNYVGAGSGTVAGGNSNVIETNALSSTIAGGVFNTVETNASYGSIGGGNNNTIQTNAQYATIPGGRGNVVATNASYSTAGGRRAKANHPGAFVWADSSNFDFPSTATNSFSVRAVGGARFVSAIDASGNATGGVSLASGGGSWSSLSDRNAKENFASVNSRQVLERVAALPLSTWNYKTQNKSIRHIGPMAQDFAAAFQVGEDNRHISTIDADGVALAAIQGLTLQLKEKENEIHILATKNDSLEKRVTELEQTMKALAQKSGAGSQSAGGTIR